MMHFAATGVSLLALIFAAVGAFTAFMVRTNDGEVYYDVTAEGACLYTDTGSFCSTFAIVQEDNDDWAGSTWESYSLSGTFSLIAFIFSIVLFFLVAGATGLKVGSVLDAGKRKLMFRGGAGVGGLAALLSMIGWIMIVSAWTDPEGSGCNDGKACSMADRAAEEEAPYASSLGVGFVFQILAFIFLAATAGLSAAAGMQEEEGKGAEVAGEA